MVCKTDMTVKLALAFAAALLLAAECGRARPSVPAAGEEAPAENSYFQMITRISKEVGLDPNIALALLFKDNRDLNPERTRIVMVDNGHSIQSGGLYQLNTSWVYFNLATYWDKEKYGEFDKDNPEHSTRMALMLFKEYLDEAKKLSKRLAEHRIQLIHSDIALAAMAYHGTMTRHDNRRWEYGYWNSYTDDDLEKINSDLRNDPSTVSYGTEVWYIYTELESLDSVRSFINKAKAKEM